MRNCLKKFVVESCVRRRAHSSLAALPARDDVKRSLSSSNSKVFTDGKYGAATTTRRSLGFRNELSFFRDIGDRSILHQQLPCSWTSKSFTSAKNLAGDENDDSPVTGKQSVQLTEKEFHAVSGDMLDQLQEKIETFGEELDIEGFEVDYSDGVLTVKLGSKGTYVINKQTPNRQIWLSSPISGPARFDWHGLEHVWVYRRTKAQLLPLLEEELSQLMGKSITLKD
jgi:frataxin